MNFTQGDSISRTRRLGNLLRLLIAGSVIGNGLLAVELPLDPKEWEKPTWNTTSWTEDHGHQLTINTKTADWHAQLKTWVTYDADIARVTFAGEMCTADVRHGEKDAEAARAQVSFHDADGVQLGGWPSCTYRSGTTDWVPFNDEYKPVAGVRAVQVWLGMYLSTGRTSFRGLTLTAYDAAGNELRPHLGRPLLNRPTDGWWAFAPGSEDPSRPLVVDLSSTLEATTGTHGALQARGGAFAFADGTPVRFWGTGAWDYRIDPAELGTRLQRLRQWGMNMIRLHGVDAWDQPDSLIDYSANAPQLLRADRLDQLDRTIVEAGKRGIYVYLDLLTKRRFTTAEGVTEPERMFGGKPAAMWDKRLIELQKEYATALLGHLNPYTGKRLGEDPTVALMEVINELTLLDANAYTNLPTVYATALEERFSTWCSAHAATKPVGSMPALLRAQDRLAWDFLTEVEGAYYTEMAATIRGLGYRGMLTGTNWEGQPANLNHCAQLGFVDRHFYWDHPAGGWTPTAQFHNRPHLSSLELFAQMAGQRVADVPFTISEWNFVWADEWLGEGPLEMAAFAGMQDFGALLAFTIDGKGWQPTIQSSFASDSKPQFLLPLIVAGMTYRRGDISAAPALERSISATAPLADAGSEVTVEQALSGRVGLRFAEPAGAKPASTAPAALPAPPANPQLRWLDHTTLIVDSPRTQALVSLTATTARTAATSITTRTPFCQVILTALDDQPIATSRHLLLLATARAQNSGQTRHAFTKGLLDQGHAPILIEPVQASVVLDPRGAKTADQTPAKVSALDWYGRRTTQTLPTTTDPTGATHIELGSVQAGWFEISY